MAIYGKMDAVITSYESNITNSNLTVKLINNVTTLSGDETSVGTESSEEDLSFYYYVGIFQSLLALIGILFNGLNLYVLISLVRRGRGISPTYHLLIAMGVADLMVLLAIGFFNLSVYSRNPPILLYKTLDEGHSDFYHILHYMWWFPGNPFSIASNWLVVATTVFRFLAVAFPMKVCQW